MTPHRPQPKVDAAGDAGQAGLEAVLFGVLVFVLGTMLVVNAWAVVDAKLAATSAAREAARSYVEAPTAQVADADARRAAEEAIAGHGRDDSRLELQLVGGRFARCARVTFEARYRVPLVAVPLLGQHGRGMVVSSRHSEVVDPYRSGPAGTAVCDGG